MTYLNGPFTYPLNIACFHTCAQVFLTTSAPGKYTRPLQSATLAGSYSSTIDTSTGIITLPDRPCLVIGSITYFSNSLGHYVRYRWYDETNSTYIGSYGQNRGLDNAQEYSYVNNTISCDEEAITIAQNIDIRLIITAKAQTGSGGMQYDATVGTTHHPYAGKTKLTIYEF